MSKELPPSRTAEQFVVRFPDGMRDRITEAAKASNRSMNAEIVSRLQLSFTGSSTGIQFSRAGPSDDSDTFFELIRAQRKTIDTQETAILMLQAYLIDIINSLPKKLQSDERVKVAAKFAMGLSDGGESYPLQTLLPLADSGAVDGIHAAVRGKDVGTGVMPAKGSVSRVRKKPPK